MAAGGVSQYLLLQSFTQCHASRKSDKMTEPAPSIPPPDKPCKPVPNSIQPVIFVQFVSQQELLLSVLIWPGYMPGAHQSRFFTSPAQLDRGEEI